MKRLTAITLAAGMAAASFRTASMAVSMAGDNRGLGRRLRARADRALDSYGDAFEIDLDELMADELTGRTPAIEVLVGAV